MPASPRIVFIGADAYAPDLMMEWAAAGHLPHFAELLKTGLRARTRGPAGIYGGGLWPSFSTGTSPGRHGYYCYHQYSPHTYTDGAFHADRLSEEAFWMRLDRAGRRVAVLDIPLTPFRPLANGIQISDWGSHDRTSDVVRCAPSALRPEVMRVAGRAPVGVCEGRRRRVGEFRRLRDELVEQVRRRTTLATHLMGKAPWDFFGCVFPESHCGGHQLWHLHDPAHPAHSPEMVGRLGGDPLLDVYRSIDRGIGTLAGHAGEGTIVVVWCSHGMGPHYDATFLLETVLQRLERPARPASPPRDGGPVRQLWRRIPFRWRRPLVLGPLALQWGIQSRRVASDRRRRRFFAVPDNNEQGAIRINLVGRDAHGLVRPGDEYERTLAELRQALLEIENVETGEPLVTGFQYPQAEHPGRHASELPDMTVEWNRLRPIRKIRSPRIGVLEGHSPVTRSGDHKPDGMVFVLHRGVVAHEVDRVVSAIDLAPTITSLLGVSAEGFDGRPIPELVSP